MSSRSRRRRSGRVRMQGNEKGDHGGREEENKEVRWSGEKEEEQGRQEMWRDDKIRTGQGGGQEVKTRKR